MAAALLVGGFTWALGVSSGVYKWVDEEGRTHYTDSPSGRAAKQLDLPSGPDESTRRSSQEAADRLLELDRRKQQMRQRAKAREKREALERRQAAEERRRVCSEARSNLLTLKNKVPVYWTNDRGERIFVEDQERPKRIADLEGFINRNCRR